MKETCYLLSILVSFVCLQSVFAQPIFAQLDTVGFPLRLGNKWYYRYEHTYGSTRILQVRVKEIIDTTSTGSRILRVRVLGQDSTLGTEQWSVVNGNFYVNSISLYDSLRRQDTSWYVNSLGYVSEGSILLRTTTLFGSTSRCQILATHSINGTFSEFWTERRVALGIGSYYDYSSSWGGELPRVYKTYSLIGILTDGHFFGDTIITSVKPNDQDSPSSLRLSQNYPNPFNPATSISFQLPLEGHTILKVYNMLGQEVAILLDSRLASGEYRVEFTAGNLPTGAYVYRLELNSGVLARRMLLMK